MKLYEKTIEDIQNKLSTTDFAKNIEEATKKIEVQKSKIESYKNALANLSAADNETGNGANYYNQLIEKAQANIDALQSKSMIGKQNSSDLMQTFSNTMLFSKLRIRFRVVQPSFSLIQHQLLKSMLRTHHYQN